MGPLGSFAEFVEWVLVCNDSPYTVCPAEEELTSPTPTPAPPETSHPPPASDPTVMLYKPTTDHGDRPAAIDEPDSSECQVRKLATPRIAKGVLLELEGGFVGTQQSPPQISHFLSLASAALLQAPSTCWKNLPSVFRPSL